MVPFMRDELEKILNQRIIFRKDAPDKPDTPLKRLAKKWRTKNKHHLEDGLVDLWTATKDFLEKAKISAETKKGSLRVYVSSLCWIWFSNFGENHL